MAYYWSNIRCRQGKMSLFYALVGSETPNRINRIAKFDLRKLASFLACC